MREISESIRFWLGQRQMTQKELAAKSGVSEAAVSKYVNGEREPRTVTVRKIAAALGVTAAELVGASPTTEDDIEQSVTVLARNMDQLTVDQRERLIRALANAR